MILGMDYVLVPVGGGAASVLNFLSLSSHYNVMTRGLIDSGDLVYFIGFIFFFLFLNVKVLQGRYYKGWNWGAKYYGYSFTDMATETITIPKTKYSYMQEIVKRYTALQQMIAPSFFEEPPVRDAKKIIKEFRNTGLYNEKFLKSLQEGLEESDYFVSWKFLWRYFRYQRG